MKLIVISYPDKIEDEGMLINQLFEDGLEHFHLRKPGWSHEEVELLIQQIYTENISKLVVHGHFELAKKYRAGGIHFTGKTKDQINDWLTFHGTKSISCHSLKELEMLPAEIDYAFLSPVFPSISKRGYSRGFQLSEIKDFLSSFNRCQVVALGGINEERLIACKWAGFDGVAVLGRIWEGEIMIDQVCNRFSKIRNSCRRIDHM